MTAFVDVQLIEGLGLPYVPGAEAALLDGGLDPLFKDAWEGLVAIFPGLSLQPLFDDLPVEQLADLLDAVRIGGEEPPDPFLWFTLPCDESLVDALVPAVQALPMIAFAGQRPEVFPAGTVSYGTNPDTAVTQQIQPAPHGVDAIYAWDVAKGTGDGVRIVDIENGWFLGHDELISANIRKLSVFGSFNEDHGTSVAGILVGADNGVGTIGIVPNAALNLITLNRGLTNNYAAAILVAAASLGSGDILLLELAQVFLLGGGPDILPEAHPPVQLAIDLATKRGVTVIELAGNALVDLDAEPSLAHTRPDSPTFSGAIVVGAGVLTRTSTWSRMFSTFGSRVDCFAAGSNVRAPTSGKADSYDPDFRGTSSASAIIAGAAASLQAMTRAATGATLAPADVRRLFRNAALGTLPTNPLGARIGPMPDLRKIVRAQGLARVLPVGAAATGGGGLLIVHLDADNRMLRRHFSFFAGWGQPIPSPSPNDLFELTAAQPAVTSTEQVDPLARLKFDAFFSGPGGIHHMFWDTLDQAGDVSRPIAPVTVAAQGRALAVVRGLPNVVVIAAISPEGRLIVVTGDPEVLLAGLSTPLVLDRVGSYRRVAGPAIVSRAAGFADIVAIEDGGALSWFTGNLFATIGTGWSRGATDPAAVQFEPGARPALLHTGDLLLAAAVGSEGWLRVTTIDPAARTMDVPVEVDVQVTIDTSGPVALAVAGQNVVVLGVDTEGLLRAATRPIAGGTWTPLLPVLSPIAISPLGGVAAVSLDLGVMAIVVGVDGIVRSSLSLDGLIWLPLLPLP